MYKRIPPSKHIMQEIFGAFNKGSDFPAHPLDKFFPQSARYMIQIAVEEEITVFL